MVDENARSWDMTNVVAEGYPIFGKEHCIKKSWNLDNRQNMLTAYWQNMLPLLNFVDPSTPN